MRSRGFLKYCLNVINDMENVAISKVSMHSKPCINHEIHHTLYKSVHAIKIHTFNNDDTILV